MSQIVPCVSHVLCSEGGRLSWYRLWAGLCPPSVLSPDACLFACVRVRALCHRIYSAVAALEDQFERRSRACFCMTDRFESRLPSLLLRVHCVQAPPPPPPPSFSPTSAACSLYSLLCPPPPPPPPPPLLRHSAFPDEDHHQCRPKINALLTGAAFLVQSLRRSPTSATDASCWLSPRTAGSTAAGHTRSHGVGAGRSDERAVLGQQSSRHGSPRGRLERVPQRLLRMRGLICFSHPRFCFVPLLPLLPVLALPGARMPISRRPPLPISFSENQPGWLQFIHRHSVRRPVFCDFVVPPCFESPITAGSRVTSASLHRQGVTWVSWAPLRLA